MYVGFDFDPADPNDEEWFEIDFAGRLPLGENIASVEWICAISDRSKVDDPDAATRLVGSPAVNGTKVLQRVGGLVDGAVYKLTAVVTTNGSPPNDVTLFSRVPCTGAY